MGIVIFLVQQVNAEATTHQARSSSSSKDVRNRFSRKEFPINCLCIFVVIQLVVKRSSNIKKNDEESKIDLMGNEN